MIAVGVGHSKDEDSFPLVRGSAQKATMRCSHCGGSGVLRLGGCSFRTCLDCLGQGSLVDPRADQRDISAA